MYAFVNNPRNWEKFHTLKFSTTYFLAISNYLRSFKWNHVWLYILKKLKSLYYYQRYVTSGNIKNNLQVYLVKKISDIRLNGDRKQMTLIGNDPVEQGFHFLFLSFCFRSSLDPIQFLDLIRGSADDGYQE